MMPNLSLETGPLSDLDLTFDETTDLNTDVHLDYMQLPEFAQTATDRTTSEKGDQCLKFTLLKTTKFLTYPI